jgi:hypothetical protein
MTIVPLCSIRYVIGQTNGKQAFELALIHYQDLLTAQCDLSMKDTKDIIANVHSWYTQMIHHHFSHEKTLGKGEWVEYHMDMRFPRYSLSAVLTVLNPVEIVAH